MNMAKELLKNNIRIIDISADFRLDDYKIWEKNSILLIINVRFCVVNRHTYIKRCNVSYTHLKLKTKA